MTELVVRHELLSCFIGRIETFNIQNQFRATGDVEIESIHAYIRYLFAAASICLPWLNAR